MRSPERPSGTLILYGTALLAALVALWIAVGFALPVARALEARGLTAGEFFDSGFWAEFRTGAVKAADPRTVFFFAVAWFWRVFSVAVFVVAIWALLGIGRETGLGFIPAASLSALPFLAGLAAFPPKFTNVSRELAQAGVGDTGVLGYNTAESLSPAFFGAELGIVLLISLGVYVKSREEPPTADF